MHRGAAVALVIIAALILTARADDDDYYEILDIPGREDASEKDIRTSFRRLSKENHPDLKGESYREKYVKIQRAYEVLGDRKKRKAYDMFGLEGLKQLEQPQQAQNQMDPFLRMFGMGGGGGQQTRGNNVNMALLVSLEDIYSGATHTIKLKKQKLCPKCHGTGAASKEDFHVCGSCNGRGVVEKRIQLMPGFVQQVQEQCRKCGGKGKVIQKACPVCAMKKVVQTTQKFSVDIEQGTPENHDIAYEMEADQSPDRLPGDLIFTVQTVPHKLFVRRGNDLEYSMKISLKEALLGFAKEIKHLDGHTVEIEQTEVTQHNEVKKIPGEGMPLHNVPSEHGTLFVRFEVELPSVLTDNQRVKIQKIFPK